MAYTETALYVDSVAYAAVAMWTASTAYTVGQIVRQRTAPAAGSERCFICTVAGTSSGTEPSSWAITKAGLTSDGTVTWLECTALPGFNGDSTNTNSWRSSQGTIGTGTLIKNTAGTHYFYTRLGGAAGTGAEPSWNTTLGSLTTESSVSWICVGPISSFTTRWAAAAKMLLNPVWNGSSWLVNAGMTVYIGDDHSETTASNYTLTSACKVLCVDHTVALPPAGSDLRTTAAITITGATASFWNAAFNGYIYGLQFVGSSIATLQSCTGAAASRVSFEQCSFSLTGATANARIILGENANSGGIAAFRDCTFSTSAATQSIQVQAAVRLENCSLTGSFGGSANQIFSGAGTFASFVAEGCDFATNVSSGANLVGTGSAGQSYGYMQFKDCKIPSNLTSIFRGGSSTMGNLVIELTRTDSAAGTTRNERHAREGVLTTSTSVVRTGGASDGVTAMSHKIDTTANALDPYQRFGALPLTIWNDVTGTNRTVTLYGLANDSRVPTDGEVFFDAEYLGQSGSPDGDYKRGYKANVLATAAPLTADTSAWDSMAATRANSTAYTAGQAIKVASNPGRVFFCTGAGTSDSAEPSGATVANIWNPNDKTASITLSNGNLTAVSGGSSQGVRAKVPKSLKFYFEVTCAVSSPSEVLGIANSTVSVGGIWSSSTSTAVCNTSSGNILVNQTGGTLATLGAFATNDVLCAAVDLVNQRIWFRKNGGNWNNNASANPATNVGGFDISAVFAATPAYPAVSFAGSSSNQAIANFGATTFAFTAPSGFSSAACLGYDNAVDGDIVADNTAAFRAACRFRQTLTLSSPQPAQAGYLYVTPRFARASQTYYLDPKIVLG